jgi:hypothetical protein
MVTVELEGKKVELDVDRDMRLTDETLDDDLCELARKIAYYAELASETQVEAARAKASLEFEESKAAQALRETASTSGTRTTEPGIREQVVLEPDVGVARNLYFRAAAQHTMVDGFYRALREKASLGIALCYKQKEEIRVNNSPIS